MTDFSWVGDVIAGIRLYQQAETVRAASSLGIDPDTLAGKELRLDDEKARAVIIAKVEELVREARTINGDTSDGYHTFNELYEFRMLYNAAYFNALSDAFDASGYGTRPVKSKRHSDGELCFGGGWFVVVADLPTGQITNHYEMKDWDLFHLLEVEKAPKWDGHTPQDVIKRLRAALTSNQESKE